MVVRVGILVSEVKVERWVTGSGFEVVEGVVVNDVSMVLPSEVNVVFATMVEGSSVVDGGSDVGSGGGADEGSIGVIEENSVGVSVGVGENVGGRPVACRA